MMKYRKIIIELPKDAYEKDVFKRSDENVYAKVLWIDKNEFLEGKKIIYPVEIKKYL